MVCGPVVMKAGNRLYSLRLEGFGEANSPDAISIIGDIANAITRMDAIGATFIMESYPEA